MKPGPIAEVAIRKADPSRIADIPSEGLDGDSILFQNSGDGTGMLYSEPTITVDAECISLDMNFFSIDRSNPMIFCYL